MSSLITALKDFMASQSSSRTNALRPPVPLRKAACTHIHLTRLYGEYACMNCGRVPSSGWVYRCVQDHDGKLPPEEANSSPLPLEYSFEPHSRDELSQPDEEDIQLKPWVEKAIREGHYTPEQVEKLKAQRRNVLECIRKDEESASQASPLTPLTPLTPTTPSTSSSAVDPLASVKSIKRFSQLVSARKWLPFESEPVQSTNCIYTTCTLCRPTARDRSWECLDHAFESAPAPLRISTDNRPVSPAHLLSQIGLRPRQKDLKSEEDSSTTDIDAKNRTDPTDSDSNEVDKHRRSLRLKRGQSQIPRPSLRNSFVEDTKRALRAGPKPGESLADLHRRADPSLKSSINLRRKAKRANLNGVAKVFSENSTSNRTEDDSKTESGNLASSESEGGEVKVTDGVAVTEEGVDLRAADIIMQPAVGGERGRLDTENIIAHF